MRALEIQLQEKTRYNNDGTQLSLKNDNSQLRVCKLCICGYNSNQPVVHQLVIPTRSCLWILKLPILEIQV